MLVIHTHILSQKCSFPWHTAAQFLDLVLIKNLEFIIVILYYSLWFVKFPSFLKRFQKLKHCKLLDLHQTSDNWKTLVKWSSNLETLHLWNMVVTDADLNEILNENKLLELTDFRVGATEIG